MIENARGQEPDIGGDGLLVHDSEDVLVERFACLNDDSLGVAHAGIFIESCIDAVVREGVVTDVYHQSGAGVRVHTHEGGHHVMVQSVDVVRGSHSCFNIVGGNEVDLVDTGCRNMDDNGWVAFMVDGATRVTQGRHYNVETLQSGNFEIFEVMPDQFTARTPPVVVEPCGGAAADRGAYGVRAEPVAEGPTTEP